MGNSLTCAAKTKEAVLQALIRLSRYVRVDEGHFQGGKFVVDRRHSGDETEHGVWVEPDVGVVHVLMCD